MVHLLLLQIHPAIGTSMLTGLVQSPNLSMLLLSVCLHCFPICCHSHCSCPFLEMCLQGSAVKAGMMIARGQQLLMADADGATKVSDLAKLEDALKQLSTPGTNSC